jgi:large subunit ribosomal protein L25|tara:strand:+ start:39 stop:722 length:684 start_codon:yes stop_codon:yes gene_type:complete
MDTEYEVDQRNVLGKKVKGLRNKGIIPANVYGKGIDSLSIQLPYIKVKEMMENCGINGFLELNVSGEKDTRPVVIRSISRHPVSRSLEHIEFFQVDKTKKIQAYVPIVLIGESSVVNDDRAILLTSLNTIQVSALPQDLPKSIELSIESLVSYNDTLTVADISLDSSIEILSSIDSTIVKAVEPRIAVEPTDDELVDSGDDSDTSESNDESADNTDSTGSPEATSDK